MSRRWGTPQSLFLVFIDELEKQKLDKIKDKISLIFKMLQFFFYIKKSTWRWKNLDDMIYSSWDEECDWLKLVILGHFLP